MDPTEPETSSILDQLPGAQNLSVATVRALLAYDANFRKVLDAARTSERIVVALIDRVSNTEGGKCEIKYADYMDAYNLPTVRVKCHREGDMVLLSHDETGPKEQSNPDTES